MIYHDVEQGTPEWEDLRLGIPTTSNFDRIVTPAKLALSSQRWTYRNQLLAEWLMGYPIDWSGQSAFMERGTDLEPEARLAYEFDRDVTVANGGFCALDDGRAGCSPDGLIGDDGGLEIKCPGIHTHIGYMLDPSLLVSYAWLQVQGGLWVTGRAWWDVVSYHPQLPPVVRRVEPDADVGQALSKHIPAFCDMLDSCRSQLARYREGEGARTSGEDDENERALAL